IIFIRQYFLCGILAGCRLRLLGKNIIEKYNLEISASLPLVTNNEFKGFSKTNLNHTKTNLAEIYVTHYTERTYNTAVSDKDKDFINSYGHIVMFYSLDVAKHIRDNIVIHYLDGIYENPSFYCEFVTGILLGTRAYTLGKNLKGKEDITEVCIPNMPVLYPENY
ncbi:MAG: hypothetical protein ACYTXE_42565, partial [Nostoc sp.]